MPGAIAKPSKGSKGPDPTEDAFLRFLNRTIDWMRDNLAMVVGGAVAVALLLGGGLWYRSYSQNLEEEASSRLQSLRVAIATGADTVGVPQLRTFLDRFGGTEAAVHARIMLARQQLQEGDAAGAAGTLDPAVGAKPVDTPLGYAARLLLGQAQEAAGRTEAALQTFGDLSENARFGFQRREAAGARARVLVEAGRLDEAASIYERLAEEAQGDQAQQLYALRLGEVRAMLSGAPEDTSGGGDGSDAGPAQDGSQDGEGAAG